MTWFVINTASDLTSRIRQGKIPLNRVPLFAQAERTGPGSVPLVILVSIFLGFTMTLLTGYQLQRFGSENLVPRLIAVAFTRELGPLITGIVVAARIGAAFTAELGSMTVGEEVDAIEGMGIGALRYLVAPRILAILFLLPCLSVIANLSAIVGSSFVADRVLNLSYYFFFDEVMTYLLIRDILSGFTKSLLFGFIIGIIACYKGLTVRGGAANVGTATTSSVVTSITTVIGCDCICNLILVQLFER